MNKEFYDKLDEMIPNPKCELNYEKDYELLITVVLSAQCTDKRVNEATRELFTKYDINSLSKAKQDEIMPIIKSLGSFTKKSNYIIEICKKLITECNGKVPNNREYLESLPGVGRKTTNVVLYELFNEPTIAVDTHVERVTKRLGLVNKKDDVLTIEKKLMKKLDEDKWGKCHLQLVLFGRYICTSRTPNCDKCLFNDCKEKRL